MPADTGFIVIGWFGVGFVQMLLLANRHYVRWRQRRQCQRPGYSWLISDALVTTAWIFNIAIMIDNTVMYSLGGLRHGVMELPIENRVPALKSNFAGLILYWIPYYCVKIAVLMFYVEVVPQSFRKMRIAVYGSFAFVVICLVVTEIYASLMCRPVSLMWDERVALEHHVAVGSCANARSVTVVVALHMVTDILVYTIPFFLLSKIRFPKGSQRNTAILIFASGFLCVITSIPVFLNYSVPVVHATPFLWVYFLCVIETTTAIFVACLPALRITFLRIRASSVGTWFGGSRGASVVEMDFTAKDIRIQLEDGVSGHGKVETTRGDNMREARYGGRYADAKAGPGPEDIERAGSTDGDSSDRRSENA